MERIWKTVYPFGLAAWRQGGEPFSGCANASLNFMKSKIYKHVELTGTSPKSIEYAIDAAIRRARHTLKKPPC